MRYQTLDLNSGVFFRDFRIKIYRKLNLRRRNLNFKDKKNLFYRKKSHRYCRVIVHFSFSSSLKASSINSPFPSGFLLGCWFLHPRCSDLSKIFWLFGKLYEIYYTQISMIDDDIWYDVYWMGQKIVVKLQYTCFWKRFVFFGAGSIFVIYFLTTWSTWSERQSCHVHFCSQLTVRCGSGSPTVGRRTRRSDLGRKLKFG